MGEIRPKKCEGRELTKDQLAVAAAVARYGFDPAPYADCLDPPARADALQQVASSDGLMDPHCTYESTSWTRNDSGLLPGSDRHPVRWEQPQLALPESGGGAVLSPEQVAHFHERGYLAMDGIWPAQTIREGRQALEDMYPSWEDWNREKQEHPRITQSHDPHVVSPHPHTAPGFTEGRFCLCTLELMPRGLRRISSRIRARRSTR